jgi:SAM-dependent methyltransferase
MLKNPISETHSEQIPFLDGTRFDDTLRVDLTPFQATYPAEERLDTLENLCGGKRVLHLGCTDHLPLIDARLASGRHLHARLTKSCAECVGIDINQDSIDHLRDEHGIDNIINMDILADALPARIAESRWDYIVLGEILEHVDDPVRFLSELRERFGACCDSIIITVPNAFGRRAVKPYLRDRIELINSDHRYWFSPYTLLKVMYRAEVTPEYLIYADPPHQRPILRSTNALLRLIGRKPLGDWDTHMAATIIGIGQLSAGDSQD